MGKNPFKSLFTWWQKVRPTKILTAQALEKIRHEISDDFIYRFGKNEPPAEFGEEGIAALLNFNTHTQKAKQRQFNTALATLKEEGHSNTLSASLVAFAAINDLLSPDRVHFRQQDMNVYRQFQDITYAKIWEDPYAQNVINQFIFYILGTGYTYYVPNKKVMNFFEDFEQRFHFSSISGFMGKFIFSLMALGEFYLRVWISKTGLPYIDVVFSYEVVSIMRHPTRRNKVLAYQVDSLGGLQWIKDTDFDEYINAEDFRVFDSWIHKAAFEELKRSNAEIYIHYSKYNFGEEVLGRVPYEPALRTMKWREDFLLSRVILNRERSRVIWKKIVKGGAKTRTQDRYAPPPTPGMMLVADENTNYEAMNADIKADEVQDDYKSILYAIAGNFGMPLEILDQRGNEAVYASIKKTSNPFHQKVWILRTILGERVENLLQFFVKKRREAIPSTLPAFVDKLVRNPKYPIESDENFVKKSYAVEDCPIPLTFPNNFSEDWAEIAEATKSLTESDEGTSPIMSVSSARTHLSLIDAEEDALISTEKVPETSNPGESPNDKNEE